MTYIIAVVVVFPPNLFSCHTEKKERPYQTPHGVMIRPINVV